MIQFIIKIILFFIIIYSCHHVWDLLKLNYSKTKTKNLVNTQISKYKQIITDMGENNNDHDEIYPDKFKSMNDDLMEHMNNQSTAFLEPNE